ncbi:alpha/beta fold hydrolase [Streptomyces sp. NBC_00986]|uniref:alpha/beta fold hydrolase n=1 Tax=Streptomyces sp. NBC_00986 TaxID=2903702 RepID=UPI00386724DB|nr:alpha/beta hydrolase [Streptomyces sp. NBC_00986]
MTPTRTDDETVTADDGVRLWASRSGSGPGAPLVLCHGGPGLWDMFDDVAGMLNDRATVVRWDQRCCGRSEPCAGPWTTARFVTDLDAVRRHFALERIVLLGHSWGASLALNYALAHPERVAALIYVSGTGIGPDADWHDAYEANLLARLSEDPQRLARWRELPDASRERAVLQWSTEFVDLEQAIRHAEAMTDPWFPINFPCNKALNAEAKHTAGAPALRSACQALDLPVVVVDGDMDIRPRSAVDSLVRALPQVRRVRLANAGHLPWVEDPYGFRDAVMMAMTAAL